MIVLYNGLGMSKILAYLAHHKKIEIKITSMSNTLYTFESSIFAGMIDV